LKKDGSGRRHRHAGARLSGSGKLSQFVGIGRAAGIYHAEITLANRTARASAVT